MSSSLVNSDTNNGIHPLSLHRIRESYRQRGALPVCDIFRYLLKNSMATDPRDLVYGMLGLLDEQDRNAITIDYKLGPMEIYQQVGRLLWSHHGEQALSELLPWLSFHGNDNGFPSWVPDFASQPIRGWRDHRTIHTTRPWRNQYENPFKSNQDVMVLQGIMFDIVQNVVITPDEFSDAEEIIPILKDIEELLLAAINCPMPPHHPLRPLNELKRQESVLQTLTKSEVETGDLFPGLDDEQVWARLMGRTPEIPIEIGGDNIFHRLSIMLKGKVLGRKVLTTETGFVGIGVPQIE
ncbi:hypothetical protein RAB80_017259, partial [Fusarium oxysporum f. sp. vasinfectum]